jgi:hypothetical protein
MLGLIKGVDILLPNPYYSLGLQRAALQKMVTVSVVEEGAKNPYP